MNTNTGNIIPKEVYDALSEIEKIDHVQIETNHMTKIQKANSKVSLHDHRSTLGKQLTSIRSNRVHKH